MWPSNYIHYCCGWKWGVIYYIINNYYIQGGYTPLDIAEGDEVVKALEKQQMKVHKT